MTELLIRRFIKNHEAVQEPAVREQYGRLSGCVGISVNLLLFAMKLAAGLASGAISILADAFNNLSDAGSSVVTLLGFRLAARPADPDHPFGHGRIEYLTGLFIAVVVMLVGAELFRTSVEKLLAPEELLVESLTVAILLVSVLLKLWLGRFYRTTGDRIHSAALAAAAADSRGDCAATAVVLAGLAVYAATGVNIDGAAGILVAAFILYSGWGAAKDTLQPLLGQAPDPAFVQALEQAVLTEEHICGVHDLVIHDYGPGRVFVSLHAELPADMDIMEAHELIDGMELRLKSKFRAEVTVHMDPVFVHDPEIQRVRALMEQAVAEVTEGLTLHDFRMNAAYHHGRNLIFDIAVPAECRMTDRELRQAIQAKARDINEEYHTVVRIDRLYT